MVTLKLFEIHIFVSDGLPGWLIALIVIGSLSGVASVAFFNSYLVKRRRLYGFVLTLILSGMGYVNLS